MATVNQIISTADTAKVERFFAEHLGRGARFDRFEEMRAKLAALPTMIDAGLSVVIERSIESGWIDVSGLRAGSDQRLSLALTDWSTWKGLAVVDATGEEFDNHALAACLFHEMTWHGWPSDTESVRDDLDDMVEALKRGTLKTRPFSPEDYL